MKPNEFRMFAESFDRGFISYGVPEGFELVPADLGECDVPGCEAIAHIESGGIRGDGSGWNGKYCDDHITGPPRT